MVSLADKFAAALNDDVSGTDLSKGVDVAFGSTSALRSSEASTASIIGISAFCLDEIVGGNCCGGLVQGNVAVFGTWMCVEEILPGLGRCSMKSRDVKALLPESFTKAPQDDKAWFLEGASKGRWLVTVNRSRPIAVVPEALLQMFLGSQQRNCPWELPANGDNSMWYSAGVGQFGIQAVFWGDLRCSSGMGLVQAFDAWQIGVGSIKATGLERISINLGGRYRMA
jgi:hypothetical protein